jgi:hypothetical protein
MKYYILLALTVLCLLASCNKVVLTDKDLNDVGVQTNDVTCFNSTVNIPFRFKTIIYNDTIKINELCTKVENSTDEHICKTFLPDAVNLVTIPKETPDGFIPIEFKYIYSNDRENSSISKVAIDTTPPNKPDIDADSLLTSNKTPTWFWFGDETGSGNCLEEGGIGVYRYRLNNPDLSNITETTDEPTFVPDVPLSDGQHTLYVQERDFIGNWSETGSLKIKIDSTAPT